MIPRPARPVALALVALTTLGNAPLTTGAASTQCDGASCTARLTPQQLVAVIERMIAAHDFARAKPLVEALRQAPDMALQARFLDGYIAEESGDLPHAEHEFRLILRDRPDLTRVRLELARTLMLEGKTADADHHFRLAEEDANLPPAIEKTIRRQRGILRDSRNWHVSVDFGIAPDTNINSATSAQSVDTTLTFGDQPVVLDLDKEARRRSGIGETGSLSAGVRLRLSDGVAMLVDADGQFTNYKGSAADDVSTLIAAGPEVTLGQATRASIEAEGAARWYGGKSLARGPGVRFNLTQTLSAGQLVGLQLDLRHSDSDYGPAYTGWQGSASASYERVVKKTMIASVTAFVRRDDFESDPYSDVEVGLGLGIGGELPHGLNAGLSTTVSRAIYDAPLILFSTDPRKDWRVSARAYLGLRSIRVAGFSPSITYTYSNVLSTLPLYQSDRHRVAFELARYF